MEKKEEEVSKETSKKENDMDFFPEDSQEKVTPNYEADDYCFAMGHQTQSMIL